MAVLMDCFGPGLVDELVNLYPNVDVARVAALVALRHSREPLKNADAYLQAACRGEFDRGGASSASRGSRGGSPPEREKHRGTFMPDGSWWDGADRESNVERALDAFIRHCIASQGSPAWAADALQDTSEAARVALSGSACLALWPRFARADQWHAAPTQSGAQEWLKRRMLASLQSFVPDETTPPPESGAAPTTGEGVLSLLADF